MFLAQANIAIFRWPLDDSRMSGFVEQIQPLNQLAERSEGFIWRFEGSYKPRSGESPWDNPLLFFNMSVWRDRDSLLEFVRSPQHIAMMNERQEWLVPVDGASSALWWIDETTLPTVHDAITAISTGIESCEA